MSVKFRSNQKYLTIAYGELFPQVSVNATNGMAMGEYGAGLHQRVSDEEMEVIKKLPDPDNIGGSYTFSQGEDHNELEVEREDVIEAMRAYIQRRHDNLITEEE